AGSAGCRVAPARHSRCGAIRRTALQDSLRQPVHGCGPVRPGAGDLIHVSAVGRKRALESGHDQPSSSPASGARLSAAAPFWPIRVRPVAGATAVRAVLFLALTLAPAGPLLAQTPQAAAPPTRDLDTLHVTAGVLPAAPADASQNITVL